jgi:hypothetical protein
VEQTVETFRALARSSPWRWRTLHFTRYGDLGPAEAWLRRPGELVVRLPDGSEEYLAGAPYTVSRAMTSTPADALPVDASADVERDPQPIFRPDGLVAERPADHHLEHGDPMWQNYTWTAMLDPDELSHDVAVEHLRTGELHGRDVWWARLRALEGYDPRCGCCPLLWSEVAARAEYADEPDRLEQFAARGYPDAHDVALDVQTGVVVALEPVGRDPHGAAFTVEIHAVDADLDEVFVGRVATH